jgi:hypothetical protein
MAKYLFIAWLIMLSSHLRAQILRGQVFRSGKDSTLAVANASIYYSGSMAGTSTVADGNFTIKAKTTTIPLTVSCIGYYSTTVNDYSTNKFLKIYLKPKVHQLREVSIGFDGMSREDKIRMFRKEFLGTSDYASSCTIANIDDVQLDFKKKTGILMAYCNGPIEIDNKKLGYHISYFLDGFIRTPKEVKFSGNFIFKEDSVASKQKRIIRNREDAYSGSRMEFIRALWSNSLKKARYKIYTSDFQMLDSDSIICLNDHFEKVINLKHRIVILHNNNYGYQSQMSQTARDCYIDKNGFYDAGVKWYGDMGIKRVGDMLPFEYNSVKSINDSIYVIDSVKISVENNRQTTTVFDSQNKLAKTASKDFDVFKSIVLSPRNLIDPTLVAKKWTFPIRYKIYGRFGAEKAKNELIIKQVDSLFNQLSHLTGLHISKTDVDTLVNFYIVTEAITKTNGIISSEAIDYLKINEKKGGAYFTSNENGFTSMVELVRPINLFAVQRQIMNGFGFTGSPEGYINSIFSDVRHTQSEKIQLLDSRIIKTFYNPAIKTGMTETELNSVLLKMFAGKKCDLK